MALVLAGCIDPSCRSFINCCFREIIYPLFNGAIYVADIFVDNISINTCNHSYYHAGNKGLDFWAVAENQIGMLSERYN